MPSDSAEDYERRIRAVCCAAWGIPPWEFDARARKGEIYWDDVQETLRFLAFRDPTLALLLDDYLDPGHAVAEARAKAEKEEREKREREQQNLLILLAAFPPKTPEDAEHRKRIEEMLRRQQHA